MDNTKILDSVSHDEEINTEVARLKALGCVEFKEIAKIRGQHFKRVPLFSKNNINHSPVLTVGYWDASNRYGYKVNMFGDDLVLPTTEELSSSIFAESGLDFERHSQILREWNT